MASEQGSDQTAEHAAVQRAREAWERGQRHDAEHNRLAERCKDFLYKQIHWTNDPGYTIDGRAQPKGTEINDLHRYKVAKILEGGPSVDARPRDEFTDPWAAAHAKTILQAYLEDGTNRCFAFRRQVVEGSQAVGTWYGEAHWDPRAGPFGNVVLQARDPRHLFVAPGQLDLHSRLCPYVVVEDHLTIAEIQRRAGKKPSQWKNTENLWPDNHGRYSSQEMYSKARGEPSPDDEYEEDTVTVLRYYARTSEHVYEEEDGERDLAPDEQYMHCFRCDRDDREHPRLSDGTLPDVGLPCPHCLNEAEGPTPSMLLKVRRETLKSRRLKYPNGYLAIVAPIQGRLFYEGDWQAPTRSFAILQLRSYVLPYEHRGGTDTLLYWSLQTLMDALRRQMYEQVVTSKPIVIMAGGPDGRGLVNGQGEPYTMSDADGQIAFAPNVQNLNGLITHFQGTGPPTSFPMVYNILASSFFNTKGTGQVTFSPERSRDVAYSSLRLQQESGDTAVDDHRQILFEEEGMLWGCILDLIVWNAPYAYFERLFGPNTDEAIQLLRSEPGANIDVIVGSPPAIKQGAIDELEALEKYDSLQNPALRKIAARKLGISASESTEIDAAREALLQQPPTTPGGRNGRAAVAAGRVPAGVT